MTKLTSPYCFDPVFYLLKFPEHAKEYAVYMALINIIMGPLSSFIAASISDRFGRKNNSMVNSYIIMTGNLIAMPMFISAVCTQNFTLSMIFQALRVLFSESWSSPSVTLLQNSTDSRKFGRIFSANMFFTSLSEGLSIALFGFALNFLDLSQSATGFRNVLIAWALFRYIGSSLAYFKAGRKQVLVTS